MRHRRFSFLPCKNHSSPRNDAPQPDRAPLGQRTSRAPQKRGRTLGVHNPVIANEREAIQLMSAKSLPRPKPAHPSPITNWIASRSSFEKRHRRFSFLPCKNHSSPRNDAPQPDRAPPGAQKVEFKRLCGSRDEYHFFRNNLIKTSHTYRRLDFL